MKKKFFMICLVFIIFIIYGCAQNKTNIALSAKGGVLKGKIIMPLSQTYVYVYSDPNQIHGPWIAVSEASSEDGDFNISNLPSGKYYIVARKRLSGQKGGSLIQGDFKSEVYGPIEINAGEEKELNLSCFNKSDDSIITNLASKKTDSNTGISGIITDSDGKPIAGIRVHVYTYIQMSERPKYVSDITGPDGKFLMYLPEGGTYYICARDRFGGPPSIGELYGRFDGGDINPTGVIVKENEMIENISISVHRVW